jgi:hypothetical protein
LEAGGKWGRRRGRGAQLRRQVGKRQKTMDVWRGQQVELERRRQQQQRVEVKIKDDNKWLGELAEVQRRCDGRVAKAEKGRAEQDRKVDLLQQELGSLLHSKRMLESAGEEVRRAFKAHGRQEMRKTCDGEIEVMLRVLRYELKVAEGREAQKSEEEVTARKVLAGSKGCGHLEPRRLMPETNPPPPAATSPPAANPTPPSPPATHATAKLGGAMTIWVTLADGHREGQMVEAVWQGVKLRIKPPAGLQPGGKFRAVLPDTDGNGGKLEWKDVR